MLLGQGTYLSSGNLEFTPARIVSQKVYPS